MLSPLGPLCEGAPPAGGGGENCTAVRNISGYGKVLSLRPFGAPPSQREVFRHAGLPSQGRWPRSRPEGLLRFAAAVGRGGVKTPPYGARDTWEVMAKSRAGHARPLQTAPNGVPTRGAREGGSPPSFPLTGCRGRLRAAYMPPLQSFRSPLRGFGGTPEFKVEEGAGALRTDSNTASV